MEYSIRFQDVAELQNDLSLYQERARQVFEKMTRSIEGVQSLGSFQGEAARSIKSYLAETHGTIIDNFDRLLCCLAADYAERYYAEFGSTPVSDTAYTSKWSSSTMSETEVKIWNMVTGQGDLCQVKNKVEKAVRLANDAGSSHAAPRCDGFQNATTNEAMQTQKVRDGIAKIEEQAYKAFSSQRGEYTELFDAMQAAVRSIGSPEMGGGPLAYTAGSFAAFAKKSGLEAASKKADKRWKSVQGSVLEMQADSFNKSLDGQGLLVDQIRANKNKTLYLKLLGTLIGAVCVVVEIASGGSATPVVVPVITLVGFVGDGLDTAGQIGNINSGGLGIAITTDEHGREVLKVGNDVLDYSEDASDLIEMFKKNDTAGLKKRLANDLNGFLESGLTQGLDPLSKAQYKEAKSLLDMAETAQNGNLTISGTANSLSKSMTIAADARIDQLDEKAMAHVKRIDDLEGTLGKKFGRKPSSVRYTTHVDEGSFCPYTPPEKAAETPSAQTPAHRSPAGGMFQPLA